MPGAPLFQGSAVSCALQFRKRLPFGFVQQFEHYYLR
jgi:hypothetical protein